MGQTQSRVDRNDTDSERELIANGTNNGRISFFGSCWNLLFGRCSRKRKRSENEDSVSRNYKIIRLDASTEIENHLMTSSSTQTEPSPLDGQEVHGQLLYGRQTVTAQIETYSQTDSLTAEIDDICQQLDIGSEQIQGEDGRSEKKGGRKGKKDRRKKKWEEEEDEMIVEKIKDEEGVVELDWMDFPFLTDARSIQHCQVSHIMLILRGLPGSGKSTLAKSIKKQFPKSVSCSADDYFTDANGVYNFKVEELKNAHQFSQDRCDQYCSSGELLVVVDNTNVKRWEMGTYFKMAEKYRYTVILAEPKTPWKYNVQELAARNSHGVSIDVLSRRVKDYERVLPRYFGWFLNLADSRDLLTTARTLLYTCLLSSHEFLATFKKSTGVENLEDLLEFYSRSEIQGAGADIIHCTAKFFRKGEEDEYMKRTSLESNVGRTTRLSISGFSLTRETFGAKLNLSEDQLELWDQNDEEVNPSKHKFAGNQLKSGGKTKKSQNEKIRNDEDDLSLSSLRISKDGGVPAVQSGVTGRRAHFTLGTSGGAKPVQTGFDILDAQRILEKGVEISRIRIGGVLPATLINLDNTNWFIHLDRCITVNSVFTGSY